MNRSVTSLLLILAIQCGLILTVYWPDANSSYAPPVPILPFSRESISRIYVGDEYDNETVVQRHGERWSLPELGNLPADAAMVDRLLDALSSDGESWPVADSMEARQRFRVAGHHYRRRIRLLQEGELLGTVYLGASPGFRKVYARNEAQNAVFSILFTAHDAPGNSGAWLDPQLLQIRAPMQITADTYSLRRDGDSWRSGTGRAPDERELNALLSALRSLQVDGLASGEAQRELADMEADLVLNVQSLTGDVTLELFSRGDRYFIHSSEYPLFFTFGAYDYDRLVSIDFRLISGEEDETAG